MGIGARSSETCSSVRMRWVAPPRTASSACARMRSIAAVSRPRPGDASKLQSIHTALSPRSSVRPLNSPLVRTGESSCKQRGLLGLAGEDVAHVAEPGEQAHHAVFTQGIDRRVGHLREHLAEVVVQAPILAREHSRAACHRPSSRSAPCRRPPWDGAPVQAPPWNSPPCAGAAGARRARNMRGAAVPETRALASTTSATHAA